MVGVDLEVLLGGHVAHGGGVPQRLQGGGGEEEGDGMPFKFLRISENNTCLHASSTNRHERSVVPILESS